MIIGVPKEIKEGENRVALTPAGAHALVGQGHTVLIEKGAGEASGLTDDDYAREGAQILSSSKQTFDQSDLIVKVKEPLEREWPLLRPGQILFTYLHLASSESLTRALLDRRIIAIAYETVEDGEGRLPLLVPMSEVAGRMSVQVAMRFLETDYKGRGILLSGVPGVPPAEVIILGCGIVGLNAAKIAAGLGAHVTVFDISHERLKYVDDVMHGNITTIYSTPYAIQKAIVYADVLIGAVLIAGARAPMLVTEQMVSRMKPGAVIIDVSVDQGGCIETIRPTTHSEPVYSLYGVLHYAVPNIPAAVPRTSTFALTNATFPYLQAIATKGIEKASAENNALASGINLVNGDLTHAAVAESLSMKWKPWRKVI
ncbi:MAG TPA: alanine dehydrogenase [Syntrophorhabdaceae bacterium]|nr:alanine dehydrogenase [Syntrophorhabdaceae bacterium]